MVAAASAGCIRFHHMESNLPRSAQWKKFIGNRIRLEADRGEFCENKKNVAELNEKTRKKCLIRDVIVVVLQNLPVFA